MAGIALLGPPAPAGGRLPKPSPPIKIETEYSADPAGTFRIAARATSRLDADIHLEILLPEGAVLTSGSRSARSRKPELRAEGSAGGRPPQGLILRASLASGGARLERIVPLVPPAAPPPAGTLKRNSRGETIREFGP